MRGPAKRTMRTAVVVGCEAKVDVAQFDIGRRRVREQSLRERIGIEPRAGGTR